MKTIRVSNGHGDLTRTKQRRLAQLQGLDRGSVDAQNGEVGIGIHTHNFSDIFAFVI